MAVEPGWFYQWYADGWFPPVWFAPADDEHLTPPERATTGGARRRPIKALPGWYTPKNQPIPAQRLTDEDEATLICIGAL